MHVTLEQKISSLFRMDEETWARHANPLSVWTRNTVLPFLILAFWSRVWLGWWALVPVAGALIWMWVNPRLFSRPESTDNWASRAVLGERVWANRDRDPVPEYHRKVPNILSAVSGTGFVFVIWGVYALEIWPTVFGVTVVYLGKLWFLDRMVWLYLDVKDSQKPRYENDS
jgi:hypothetical protein